MKTNDFYTSIDDAKIEIQKRWQDADLRDRVRLYLGGEIPTIFHNKPYAVVSRNIATPDIECMRFLELSQEIGLHPVVFEGVRDKFSSASSDKIGLVKLSIFDGYNKNNELLNHYRKIIDMSANDGMRFNEIDTIWGENLVKFHHRILQLHINQEIELFDDFDWFKSRKMKTTIDEYYKNFLCFFACYGVLFENFVTDHSEKVFFDNTIKPAFDFVTKKFGVSPLIVELAPHEEADDPYWWCYPSEVENYFIDVFTSIE